MTTPSDSAPRKHGLGRQVQLAGLIAATLAIIYLCFRILFPFLSGLVWAVALTIVASPLYRWLERKLKNRTVSSLISVVAVVLLVVIPILFVAQQLVTEAAGAVRTFASAETRAHVGSVISNHRLLAPAWDWIQRRVDLGEQMRNLAAKAGSVVPAAFALSANGLTQFLVALFSMFFLLRDSDYFLRAIRYVLPLSQRDADDVLSRVQKTVEATLRGRIAVAAVQGALGGIMFWILGLRGPLVWGTVMALLSIVPLIGAFIVWIPAALYLAVTGSVVKAAILTVWGVFVVGTVDNFLYPVLVGKDLQQHTLKLFFALLGGVAAFGVSGIVIGPVVFALIDALVDIWGRLVSRDAPDSPNPAVARATSPPS